MSLLDWNHVQEDYPSLLCTRRSIHHAGGLRCYIYMPDESKRGHVELTFQNFIKFLWKHVFKLRKKRNPWMLITGWMECEYLIMPSLQLMSNIFRFIIKPCCKAANEAIRKLGMIKSGFKNRSKDIMLPLYKSMVTGRPHLDYCIQA